MSDAYYQIKVGSNEFTFVVSNITENLARDIVELPIPYVKNQLLYDQITTINEVQITGKVPTGSSYPYLTTKDARAAVLALFPSDIISNVTFRPGDWNGSTFSVDSSRNWDLPDSGEKLLIQEFQLSETPDELGRLSVTITLKIGVVL